MEETIIDVLDQLVSEGYLNQSDYKRLKPCGSRPGVMYGLCKVHKGKSGRTPPFRPILSAIGTATYSLAKYLVDLLSPIMLSEFCLKDSFSFSKEIRSQDSSLFMASLDVESLFTNIPLEETMTLCSQRLYCKKKKVGGLLKRHFEKLLRLATLQSCFIFNNRFYRQIDGVAMGSPLGPCLANTFMSHHEVKWLNDCPSEFKPIYYRRYVDDIIVLFKDKSHLTLFVEYMNSQHPNIKFTKEEEKDNTLPFLDVCIKRENGSFTTSLYRKDTFSGVYTNYKSHLSNNYKLGLIFTLLHRAYTICSDNKYFHCELNKIKDILLTNGYPLFVIDRSIRMFLNKIRANPVNVESDNRTEVFITLPFLGQISTKIRKELTTIFKRTAPHLKLKVAFVSNIRLKNMFSFKDRIPQHLQSLVLYKFTCNSCNAIYPGKTKRHYKVRLNEHLGISFRTERPLTYAESTATAVNKHCETCMHPNDETSFKIIGGARNNYHLMIMESLILLRTGKCLNTAERSIPLKLFG